MNPITIVGAIAAAGLLAYAGVSVYHAGEQNVQSQWDKATIKWQAEESAFKTKITGLERSVVQSQKEAQDAHAAENQKSAELVALQRNRTDAAVAGLRNAAAELSKRLAPKSDDTTALTECKAIASTYQ